MFNPSGFSAPRPMAQRNERRRRSGLILVVIWYVCLVVSRMIEK